MPELQLHGVIWDESNDQYQHQSIQKSIILNAKLAFFVHI